MSDQPDRKFNVAFFRSAGVLLHPTSLPSDKGFGTLGSEAFNFVDFMAAAKLTVWQMLPLGPPQSELSPYQCSSVHAGNPDLIDLQNLQERGWLCEADLKCED